MDLEKYFLPFREKVIGSRQMLGTPYGHHALIYADWMASGRLYREIEGRIAEEIGPMVANTHSEASAAGRAMTLAYGRARQIIKEHVNANEGDALICEGSGMTGVVNKLQRLLGLRLPEDPLDLTDGLPSFRRAEDDAPVVFITHMEHHSNHTSWLETIAEVVVLEPGKDLQVRPEELERQLAKYEGRKLKIGSFSAASNVTGVILPYRELAGIMHRHGGYALVDFAASAPYVDIDMHPAWDADGYLDAVFFSPHKFLGGPGSSGVLVFNKQLYHNRAPDNPGGGTVAWTNRWNEYAYVTDIEAREDGGTPGFLQTIRGALAIKLKEAMGVASMAAREQELLARGVAGLKMVPGLHLMGEDQGLPRKEQLGVLSFFVQGIHHNLIVALLSDRYGIQVRGGCSCAGTYGHWLLHVNREESARITREISEGNLVDKPGWVRLSLHPTMSNAELETVCRAVREIEANVKRWRKDYRFNRKTGEFDFIAPLRNSYVSDPSKAWLREFH